MKEKLYYKEEYTGHQQWGNDTRQWVHTQRRESLKDVITIIRECLIYYGRTDLTFDERGILKEKNNVYVVTFLERHAKPTADRSKKS
jgi:hypothetical protein